MNIFLSCRRRRCNHLLFQNPSGSSKTLSTLLIASDLMVSPRPDLIIGTENDPAQHLLAEGQVEFKTDFRNQEQHLPAFALASISLGNTPLLTSKTYYNGSLAHPA